MSEVILSRDRSSARVHLHVALGGILLACLAPILSWTMALIHLKDGSGPWRRWLFALAIVDTVVAIGFMLVAFGGAAPVATAPQPRIGVSLDAADRSAVKVVAVLPRGPADVAGVQVGDKILSVDGEAVRKNEALTEAIGKTPAGATRKLRLARGSSELDVEVVPRLDLGAMPARSQERQPLFQKVDEPATAYDLRPMLPTALAELVVIAIICAIARRRGAASLTVGLGLVPVLAASTLAMVGTLELFRVTAGMSLGAMLASSLVGGGALLVGALVLRRVARVPPIADDAAGRSSTLSTVLLGVFYAVTGALRVAVLAVAVSPNHVLVKDTARSVGPYLSWGPGGIVMTVVAMVILVPLGEELLYRGVLLPWLRTWSTPLVAVFLSALAFAAGHLHYEAGASIIFVYGLVLGWARLRTGNLRASVALHMLLNATVCAATMLRT